MGADRDAYTAGRDQYILNVNVPLRSDGVPDDPNHRVFVVHGRNDAARSAMFEFLRAIGLKPIEWSEAVKMTGKGTPYIGDVLDAAFDNAQAIVVLFTPDDVAHLRDDYASGKNDPEINPQGQARPNVLFEAGIAMGRHPERTILVELGQLRPFSDIGGRHSVRMDNSPQKRNELAQRLRSAGCAVSQDGNDWLTVGDFSAPPSFNSRASDKRPSYSGAHSYSDRGVRSWISVDFLQREAGGGTLKITNISPEPIYDLNVEPQEFPELRFISHGLPIYVLPPAEVLEITCTLDRKPDTGRINLVVTGRTENDHPIRLRSYVYA